MVLVSAVIPTRGRPELLLRAVRSVLAQTLREIEAVVVIDGQDLATEHALETLAREDGRVRVIALPVSVGGSDARNRGVAEASGKWIAFLDDDDEWLPGKLEAQLEAVAASTAPVVIGTCKIIARTPGNDYVWPRRMPEPGEPICEYLLARRTLSRGEGSIQTSTFFVRRSLMLGQPFKSGQLKHQDTEWLLRVGRLPGAEAVFVNEVMAIHYIEEERASVSSKANWRYSLAWVRSDRHLFTPRALTGFVLHQIAPEASEQGEWRAFPMLLFEVLRHGKASLRDYAIFLAMWVLPRRRRRYLRDWIARRPALRPLVHSR
ncbi:glycosyltransferase family 2 protein [Granulicella sp. S156]|jgi:glycosyltransferase involved in cell wall biosynthesis|uniref:glycosyltransferase family 2 protein n=1 Tax=Granulicella sp. S156 TaxID=1747224 RepID=UPI00131DD082|nr:glycosyltransferase family 2 protein [Granulicella sp. S156]